MKLVIVFFLSFLSLCFSFYSHHRTFVSKIGPGIKHDVPSCSMAIVDFTDDSGDISEGPKTHGYEGDFKIGDVVKVTIHAKIYHVKKYSKEGFDPYGFIGTVDSLALYGRKKKTLCSAITPVRIAFLPENKSLPTGMFDKKWIGHFSGQELELVERPPQEPV